uniref:Uncharacterized protein n=1 Tax=Physcomitrium patens TaxID=3218 RepID=A0A7I4F937_PHYPA
MESPSQLIISSQRSRTSSVMAKVFHLPTTSDGRRDRCPLSEQLYLQPLSWNSPKSKTPGRSVMIYYLQTFSKATS